MSAMTVYRAAGQSVDLLRASRPPARPHAGRGRARGGGGAPAEGRRGSAERGEIADAAYATRKRGGETVSSSSPRIPPGLLEQLFWRPTRRLPSMNYRGSWASQ